MVGKRLVNTGGAVAAFDSLQNFETVTYTGNGGTQKITGYIRKGAAFNGSSSRINYSSIFTGEEIRTYSFWFNTDSNNTGTVFISGGKLQFTIDPDATNSVTIYKWKNGQSQFTTGTPNNMRQGVANPTINLNQWYHGVVIMSGTADDDFSFYLNGSQVSLTYSDNYTAGYTNDGDWIGTNGRYSNVYYSNFSGKIDQVRIFDKALSSSEVTTLYGETYASSTKSTTDIFGDGSGVALYQLDEDANDTGTGGIDSGQSAVFNGSSSFIDTGISGHSLAWGYSGWFNTTATSGVILASLNGSGSSDGVSISLLSGGVLRFIFAVGGTLTVSSGFDLGSGLNDGNWHFFAYTWDGVSGNDVAIRIDNNSYSYTPTIGGTTTSDTTLKIGRAGIAAAGGYLNGKIDQVRIYSSALSSSDVTNLYNESSVPTTNLIAHYKLDGNANDETGSYNGTATSITYSDPAEYPTYDGTATNVSYAYDGTPTNVSFVGTSFQPDLVWIKSRSDSDHHVLLDSIRGGTNPLMPSGTSAEIADTDYIQSFDSNGFTVRVDTQRFDFSHNESGDPLVAWCWKAGGTVSANNNTDGSITSTVSANTDAGFSIATYTGNNTQNATVGHGLGIEQKMVIIKRTDAANSWWVPLPILGSNKFMELNTTAAATTDSQYQYTQTSDVFKFTSSSQSAQYNASGGSYVMYSFADIDGYQKVGSYTGNGSSAKTVYTTFEPRWIMIKRTDSTGDWYIYDQLRDGTNDRQLYANLSDQESTTSDVITYNSDGFTIAASGSGVNASGGTYIYLAIA